MIDTIKEIGFVIGIAFLSITMVIFATIVSLIGMAVATSVIWIPVCLIIILVKCL